MCAVRETGKNPRVRAVHGSNLEEAQMLNAITARPPRDLVKWCAGGLLLLMMPGSFVVPPLWWLGRYVRSINQP
jgi:hypothetical protein